MSDEELAKLSEKLGCRIEYDFWNGYTAYDKNDRFWTMDVVSLYRLEK